jgi:hypothetical protein
VLEVHPRPGRPDPRRDEVAGTEAEREQGVLVTPEDPAEQSDKGVIVDEGPDGSDELDELEDWAEEDPDEPLTVVPEGLEIDPDE